MGELKRNKFTPIIYSQTSIWKGGYEMENNSVIYTLLF